MRPNTKPPSSKAKRPAVTAPRPASARPWPSSGRPRAYPGTLPYPVYERVTEPAPAVVARTGFEADPEQDLTWLEAEPLADLRRPSKAGLFVIERADDDAWSLLHVGMSATDVGDALRWIVRAPAMLGLELDWGTRRVRIAEAGFDTSTPAGRAKLRRLRDETDAAMRGGDPIPSQPGVVQDATPPSVRFDERPRPPAPAHPSFRPTKQRTEPGAYGAKPPLRNKMAHWKRSFPP